MSIHIGYVSRQVRVSMYYSTMKLSSFLIIILGFTLRKSLAGLVISSSSDKYDEFSIVKAAVSIFFYFTVFKPLKYNVTLNSNFFRISIKLKPFLSRKIFKDFVQCANFLLVSRLRCSSLATGTTPAQ